MPRTKFGDRKIGFTIALSPQALSMIEQLIGVGLYGTNQAEVVRSLVNDRLEDLIAKGVILRPKLSPSSEID